MRFALLVALLLASPVFAQTAVDSQPNNAEMLAIYEINRARHDPQAYDTANALGGILVGITPSPPLAVHLRLTTSSRFHSQEMATNGYFAHTSPITGNQPNLMVRNAGYPLIASFPSAANNLESLACQFTSSGGGISYAAATAIRNLIVDTGVSPPGHRYHLLAWGGSQSEINFYRQFREIGVGYVEGFRPESPFSAGTPPDGSGAYYSIHTGVRDVSNPWLTGVVFNDTNANGRYDLGEGLAGVTVSVTGPASGTATTNNAGGWSFQASAGTWNLTCSGGSFAGSGAAQAVIATDNVEVDFRSGQASGDVNFGTGSITPPPGGGSTGGGDSGGGCSTNGAWTPLLLALMAATGLLAAWRQRRSRA